MRRRILLVLTVCMIILIAITLLAWNLLNPTQTPPKYKKTISRNTDNLSEETILSAAESINYSAITSLERFKGSSDPEAYLQPSTYLAYTYANFIDAEVINYYETRYDSLQGKIGPKYPRHIELTYKANVTEWGEIRIFNNPGGNMTKNNQTIAWHNNTVVFVKANDSIPFMSGGFMGYSSQVYFRNQSKFQLMEPEFDINLSNCFIIEMELVYSEYYAPLAAYRSGVYQVVVLDQELNPIMLCFEWQNMVS